MIHIRLYREGGRYVESANHTKKKNTKKRKRRKKEKEKEKEKEKAHVQ
jgi:hypothetical protein